MELAAAKRTDELYKARLAALQVARLGDGTADIERVREHLEAAGVELEWGNWAGSVFAGKKWEPTGRRVEVRHKGGHCRGGGVREWRLKG